MRGEIDLSMNDSLISVRYAKALFLLSKEKKEVDHVYEDMKKLSDYLKSSNELISLLESPVITPGNKKKAFSSVFKKQIHELTMNFLNVLIDNKREILLSAIARDYQDFYKAEKKIKSVTLYTAFKLTDDYLQKVKGILQKELDAKIEMKIRVRDNLIGGFILMVDGKMMDASVAHKLKEIKKKLLN